MHRSVPGAKNTKTLRIGTPVCVQAAIVTHTHSTIMFTNTFHRPQSSEFDNPVSTSLTHIVQPSLYSASPCPRRNHLHVYTSTKKPRNSPRDKWQRLRRDPALHRRHKESTSLFQATLINPDTRNHHTQSLHPGQKSTPMRCSWEPHLTNIPKPYAYTASYSCIPATLTAVPHRRDHPTNLWTSWP